MVWESLACPRISINAGSDTKKNLGNISLFFSIYPLKDFWLSSNCSCKCGNSWDKVSSPTQQVTTFGDSRARCMIFCEDLSIFENLLASLSNCHAISPPTNTTSKYIRRCCTNNQFSRMSVEFDNSWTQSWIFFLNGALYLDNEIFAIFVLGINNRSEHLNSTLCTIFNGDGYK